MEQCASLLPLGGVSDLWRQRRQRGVTAHYFTRVIVAASVQRTGHGVGGRSRNRRHSAGVGSQRGREVAVMLMRSGRRVATRVEGSGAVDTVVGRSLRGREVAAMSTRNGGSFSPSCPCKTTACSSKTRVQFRSKNKAQGFLLALG